MTIVGQLRPQGLTPQRPNPRPVEEVRHHVVRRLVDLLQSGLPDLHKARLNHHFD